MPVYVEASKGVRAHNFLKHVYKYIHIYIVYSKIFKSHTPGDYVNFRNEEDRWAEPWDNLTPILYQA